MSFRVQAMDLIVEHCPRCLARGGRVSELHLSDEAPTFSGLSAGLSVGEPPEPVAQLAEPILEESPEAAVEEHGEAEIELRSIPQLG